MANVKSGSITSADNGTNIPATNGFVVEGPFNIIIAGGTTISATLQRLMASGSWVTMPDSNSRSTISGAVAFNINAQPGDRYRIAVTTATGTWSWEASGENVL